MPDFHWHKSVGVEGFSHARFPLIQISIKEPQASVMPDFHWYKSLPKCCSLQSYQIFIDTKLYQRIPCFSHARFSLIQKCVKESHASVMLDYHWYKTVSKNPMLQSCQILIDTKLCQRIPCFTHARFSLIQNCVKESHASVMPDSYQTNWLHIPHECIYNCLEIRALSFAHAVILAMQSSLCNASLTHKQLEMHGCIFSTVATDGLVL